MRLVALAATVLVLLAALGAGLSLSGPATGATPKCEGRAATMVGSPGDDVITGTAKADVIVGLGGDDRIDGQGGDDVVCGNDGADTLLGSVGNDHLYGGRDASTTNAAGNALTGDVLDGGPGDDVLDGGYDDRPSASIERADTFSYASADRGVTVDLSGRTTPGTGQATGAGQDTLVLSQRMAVTGSAYADTITGSPGRDRIDAGAGNDTVDAGAGFDFVLPDGPDGQPGDDVVNAGAGPDVVSSLAGRDQLSGGPGGDHLEAFSPLPSQVLGGRDDDWVGQDVTPGDGSLGDGGPGADTITFYGRPLVGQTPRARFTVDLRTGVTYSESTPSGTGTIEGFEGYRFVDDLAWRFYGSPAGERVWAIDGGPLVAHSGDGDDRITGTPDDDRIDGGAGRDAGFGEGGTDACSHVELGHC